LCVRDQVCAINVTAEFVFPFLQVRTNVAPHIDGEIREACFETCLHVPGRGLRVCDALYCCGRIPTFQRSMLPTTLASP